VTRVTRGRALGFAALACVALAFALPMQSTGCAQTSHYAATRAIADGAPTIDRYARETCDLVRENGHAYAAKGPLMDFWSAPWYLLLHAVGAVPRNPNAALPYPAAMYGVPLRALWQIGLWAVVLPALALLLLLRYAVERLEPGVGTAAAVVLGLGTLVLPFSTMLFAHVPATLLAFLSFVLLWRGRSPALAGLCAGLAISTDLPLAAPAVLLGLYAAARAPRVRRLVEFACGGAVGLVPLLAFDAWAFGNPFHLAYSGVALNPGAGGQELSPGSHGFYTLHLPSPHVAVALLLSRRGLLVLTPVLAAGAAGCVSVWRRGLRAEAVLIAALCVTEVVWNSGHNGLFMSLGGWVPGPRFLIPLLPFLCFALAPLLRRAPLTVGALALISIAAMSIATSAEPLLSNDDTHHWIARIVDGNFAATVLSLSGIGHGWLAILPFYALVLAAVAAAVAVTRVPVTRTDAMRAVVAVAAWIVVERGAPALLHVDDLVRESWGAIAAVLLLAGAAWAVVRPRPEALLLVPFVFVRFDEHTKWAVLFGLFVLAALATRSALPRRRVAL
jgi:hypothetical protein